MFFRSFRQRVKEEAEKESREEIFRIAREWDSLSLEEKEKRSLPDFFRARWKELDEERVARRRERGGFQFMFLPFVGVVNCSCCK